MVITVHNINEEQEENKQEEDEKEEQEKDEKEEQEREAEQQQQQQQQQQQDEQQHEQQHKQQQQQPMINDPNWGNVSEENIIAGAGRLRPRRGWEKKENKEHMRGGCWGVVGRKRTMIMV